MSIFKPLGVLAASNVTLAWDASTGSQVVGYNVYYGGATGSYTNMVSVGKVTTAVVSNLVVGATYYFSAKAVDSTGLESDASNEAVFTNSAAPPPNQPPTLNVIANVTLYENAGLQTVSLAGITSGATNENQTLTVTASSGNTSVIPNPTVSYTSPSANGSLSFTPVANANGTATITVTVNDGGASNNIVTRSFTVTVNSVNQAPTLNSIANLTVNENAGLQTVNLAGIGSGAANEAQTLTVTAASFDTTLIPNPTVSYTSPSATGTLTFTPVANAAGVATISVTVNDGGTSNNIITRAFTVTINPVNQQPTLNPLSNVTLNENAGLQTVNLSGIGSGAANENQTLTVTASSGNTSVIPNPTVSYTSPATTGSLSFTPAANANGSATITVTVNDGGASNNIITRSFTVTVNSVNQAPTLNAIANVSINENAGLQTVNLAGIGSGAANENQTLTVTASSGNTSVIPNPTVSYTSPATTGSLSFTPVANANGTATITVTVNDGGASNNIVTQSFTVTVNSVNQAPTLNTIANLSINENAGLQTVNLAGIGSGAANESQTLTITASSGNTSVIPNPTVSYTSPSTTGSLSFTPVANANGTATITVTVNDGGASNNIVTRSFTVTVNSVNQAPTLNTIANLSINENAGLQTVNLSGVGSGAANENQTLTVTASSGNTSVIPNPTVSYTSPATTGSLSFTPVANANGSATITVTVNDGAASNNIITRSFTVTVNSVNQAPTLNAIANVSINENAGLQTVNLSGIGSGAANENQTLTVTASSGNTSVIPNPTVSYTSPATTGSLSFTPVANATGSATITVTVNDGGASNNIVTQSFTVTVNSVNQAPTLNAIANVTLNENAGLQTVNLAGIGSGAANETQTLTVTASSGNTGVIPNPTVSYTSPATIGSLSFTPVANANGSATITVTVNDGGASNNIVTRSFTVTINPVNQPPTLNTLADLTVSENAGSQTVNLSGISSGAPNETQTLTVTAASFDTTLISNPTVSYTSPSATGTLTFTPVANASGVATISVTVNDGGTSNNIITRAFNVTINPVNQAPTLNPLSNITVSENAGSQTVNLSGIGSGAANETQTLTVTASSGNTSVVPNPIVSYISPATTGSLSFTPVANTYGTSTITVTVNDGAASNNIVTRSFSVTVSPVNQPPTLNALANVTLNENAGLQTVNLSGISSGAVNETQTLTVTAVSANPSVVPNPSVSYTSPSATGSISFTPAANATGSAIITVAVNDGGTSNNVVSRSFTVTVNHLNQPPTISSLTNLLIAADSATDPLPFTVADAETAASSLTVSGTSSDQALVRDSDIVFGGNAGDRTVTVTPVPGQTGSANITVTVSDGTATASSTFQLSVEVRPPAPTNLRIAGP